jgi:uncharacterized damage-inducible protein DinB
MKWVIEGLDDNFFEREVTKEENLSSILKMLRHIGNAETYWFHKNGHGIGPPIRDADIVGVLKRLNENTDKICDILRKCVDEEFILRSGLNKQTPSIAWCVLRTYQHGIYHTGQIAKIRRLLGAPELTPHEDSLWSSAVDAVIEIVENLTNH